MTDLPVDDTEEDRTVISLQTRKPVETPEPEEVLEEIEVVPDEDDIKLLEQMLERVKSGKIRGLVVFAGHFNPRTDHLEYVTAYDTMMALENYQMFIGGFEEQKVSMFNLASDLYDSEDKD